ncbi:MAG: PQQ-dependent sugar dehydrogenase, partial [Polyangiales bacterium]
LAFRSDGLAASVEHGPNTDDEVNALLPGNFGWDPGPGYDEGVPMTDLSKYPHAIEAIWSSGSPTIAPSGADFLRGSQWGGRNGYLAVATLKASHLRLFLLTADDMYFGHVERISNRGRLRAPRQGPDGNLYVTTDGGSGGGEVLRVEPSAPPN